MHKSKVRILFCIGVGILFFCILVVTIHNRDASKNVGKGTIQAGVYTNKLFGVSFSVPEGFNFASKKQISELEKSQNADGKKGSVLNNEFSIDMMAENELTGEMVSIMITNLGELGTTQNQEAMVDGFMKYLNQNTEEKIDILNQGKAKLGGIEYDQVTVLYDYDDIPIVVDTYLRKKDKDMITIQFVVAADSMNTALLKNNFKPLN